MRPLRTSAWTDSRARLGALVLVGVAALVAAPAFAVCDDSAVPEEEWDCDDDGWSPAEGDCEDRDPQVHPGMEEICDDERDNTCDGFIDEGCDRSWERGTLQGGAGCAGGTPVEVSLILLLLARRRR